MANQKISDMTETTTATGSDLVPVVINPGTTPANRRTTIANILSAILPSQVGHSGKALVTNALTATWGSVSVSTGDVVGPAVATSGNAVLFLGTSGKTVQNSAVAIDSTGSINIPSGCAYKVNNIALPAPVGGTIGSIAIKTSDGSWVVLAQSTSGLALLSAGTAALPVWGSVAASGASFTRTSFAASGAVSTSGDVVVSFSATLTAPYSFVYTLWNQSGTQIWPDSCIATATQATVNVFSYLTSGTLAGTFGFVYAV